MKKNYLESLELTVGLGFALTLILYVLVKALGH